MSSPAYAECPGRTLEAPTNQRARTARTRPWLLPYSTAFAVECGALMGAERLTRPEDLDGSGPSVARARARQMRRRVPLFAAAWLGGAVGWSIGLFLESLLT